jgi:hypothetical protein
MCKFKTGDFVISTDNKITGTIGKKGMVNIVKQNENCTNITVHLENNTYYWIQEEYLEFDTVKIRKQKISDFLAGE